MNNLVIIGPTHHNTYSMVRCFGENGIKPDVILYGKTDSYILQSLFVNKGHVVDEAVEAIKKLEQCYQEAVVIACADDIASLMDLRYDELTERYHFFNCGSTGKLTQYMDKSVQAIIATEVGFKVPESLDVKSNDLLEKELPYPCIIKPLESIHGGKNIQICRTKEDLPLAIANFNPKERLLVQEFVEKDFEIVVVGLSFADRVEIPAYIHKHRDTKGGTTYSTVMSIETLLPAVLKSCKSLISKMNYQGLFGVELINKGNEYYFVEVNLRNDATTYAIAVAGCNLPLAYWKLCNSEKAADILNAPINSIHAMVEFNDFAHVVKGHVSLSLWNKQRKEAECRYNYSSADIDAYKIQRVNFAKSFLKIVYMHIFKRFY